MIVPARLSRWSYALKLKSWPKLLVPMFFGQTLGVVDTGRVDLLAFILGLLFTISDLGFIVLLNDWGDREVDSLKRRMFPADCSPKTIPDGILPEHALLFAGLAAGVIALGTAMAAEFALDRSGLTALAIACLLLFVAYTLPPLKLNYRGGGELLEALGVGALLPAFHVYLQSGSLTSPLLSLLGGFTSLSLASAIASGLSDERSDAIGGKRTLTTVLGNPAARAATVVAVGLGLGLWFAASLWLRDHVALATWLLPAAAVGLELPRMLRANPAAVTDAFSAQAKLKVHLHHLIWYGTGLLSLGLLLDHFAT